MTIPSDFLPVEGQEGLYYKDNSFMFGNTPMVSRELRADDDHCFYDINEPEEERIYMEQCFTPVECTVNFVCIPREEWMEIAKDKDNTEIA